MRYRWSRGRRAPAVAVLAAALALTAGCTGERAGADPAAPVASPLAECTELTAPPGGVAAGAGGGAGTATATDLPALTLSCFTGEQPVTLTDLRGPAVVNLWASWCLPCREELPALQRYADRAAGQVHVIGVVSEDTRARAAALAEDLDITFPSLFDREGALSARLGTLGLPVTLFIDEAGQLRYLHQGPPFDEARLSELVTEHLGVAVPVEEGEPAEEGEE